MENEMDMFTAVAIAEGMVEADDEETLDAYQYLVDTGLVWQMQGSFGRVAQHLIDAGLIKCNGTFGG
jgi:hypothetical protein